jgi:superfamily I DNA/RNA helicase
MNMLLGMTEAAKMEGVRVCSSGTLSELGDGFVHVRELVHLYKREYGMVHTEELLEFAVPAQGFEAYRNTVKNMQMTDKLLMCRFVENHGRDVVPMIDAIEVSMQRMDARKVHFDTAHGSKGRTFDSVYVAPDFKLRNAAGVVIPAERNVTYVALTRARKACYVADALWGAFWE